MATGKNDEKRSIRRRQYPPMSAGPFIVIAESVDEKLDLAKLAKDVLRVYGKNYVKAMQLSRRKAKFLMASAVAANHLAAAKSKTVRFNVPQRLVECLGVASIDGAEDEDLEYLVSFEKSKMYQTNNPEIIEVRRMQKRGDKNQIPLPLVVITFSGNVLPSHVEMDNVLYPVRKYNYPVRQCRQCWRFGHMVKQCKSKPRCSSCQSETMDNDHECIGGPVCVNCSGDHRADDRNKCPTFGKKKEEEKKRQSSFSQGKTDWFAALTASPNSGVTGTGYLPKDPIHDQRNDGEHFDADEEALGMKRKNPEDIDISDDEGYPPLKQRSAYQLVDEVSSDGDNLEMGEPSSSQVHTATVTATDEKEESDQHKQDTYSEVPNLEGNVEEMREPISLAETNPTNGGKGDIPNRL